jgi:hypothetical protein
MILKKGRLASLRAVRRGLGVAAGYLSSGTLWAGFEFRIASRKPRSSGLARSGAILPLSAARLANVAPTPRFGRQRLHPTVVLEPRPSPVPLLVQAFPA